MINNLRYKLKHGAADLEMTFSSLHWPLHHIPINVYKTSKIWFRMIFSKLIFSDNSVANREVIHIQHRFDHVLGTITGVGCIQSVDWWTGLDWTGLDWTGMEWNGLDWTRIERNSLSSTKLKSISLHNTGATSVRN